MRISIDAMGGDFAPHNEVAGAIQALKTSKDIKELHLVGDQKRIEAELSKAGFKDSRLHILHASQVVGMDESPSQAVRRKKDSSLSRAIDLAANGRAEIVISAGNTGAIVVASHLKLRTLEGVDRPGLACVMPGKDERFVLMDAGANLEPQPHNLFQYAHMGTIYAREILKVENPRVGLFSIGTEDMKGNELIKEAHKMIRSSGLNFVGNLDGHELFSDNYDVLIADAFVGNAVLKTAESTFRAVKYWLNKSIRKTPLRKLGYGLARGAFADLKKGADPDEFGGAVMLGINGLCFKAHGSASPRAFRNTILRAIEFSRNQVNDKIVEAIKASDIQKHKASASS